MPLLDDLGLAPYVAPTREQQQAQRTQLNDLLRPLTEKPLGRQSSALQQDLQDQLRQARAQRVAETVQPQAFKMITDTLFSGGKPMTPGAKTMPSPISTATPASLSGIIGKRNYLTGRGDATLRSMAQQVASRMGWGPDQFMAWDALINAESGWRPTAQNPTSTAFGLGQFLNSTWSGYGAKTSDPATQLDYMARYIQNRYKDPISALLFHSRRNYY